ncbi:MAG: MFS transporter [Acidimicrobiia bacterium]
MLVALFVVGLDNTILGVLVPELLRDLDTTFPTLQWAITGYPVTFAALLVVGGRLGDVFGFRRTLMVGSTLFGLGSLTCALATDVGHLLLGKIVLEGTGAALMFPGTLAVLARTYHGAARNRAFAWYGAVAGASVALGPLVGGYFTTAHSWRWAFAVNVVVTPVAVAGGMRYLPRDGDPPEGRRAVDLRGAFTSGLAMFALVFGISQSTRYGWWAPLAPVTALGRTVWPADAAVSVVPVALVGAGLAAAWFVHVERAGSRAGRDVLFDLSQLRHARFRYGLVTIALGVMGQLGMLLVLAVYLQSGLDLSAVRAGIWVAPFGVALLAGAHLGGWVLRYLTLTASMRLGLALLLLGPAILAATLRDATSFGSLVGPIVLSGLGAGMANAQLTNVALWDVREAQLGAASGIASTARQAGIAFGLALMGATLASLSASRSIELVGRAAAPDDVRALALARITRSGASVQGTSGPIREAVEAAIASATRGALVVAAVLAALALALSLLIPPVERSSFS